MGRLSHALRAVFAILLFLAASAVSPASAQSLVANKKLCDAAGLPAAPTPADFANCPNVITATPGTLYYYVVSFGTVGAPASVTVSDAVPANFAPTATPAPQLCSTAGCAPANLAGVSVALAPGVTNQMIVPGYFTAGGMAHNTATIKPETGPGKTAEHDVHVDLAQPIPGNLSIAKTADITSGSLGGGGGSITVHYTITLSNAGAGDLYLGGLVELVDQVGILPGPPQASSLLFDYGAQNFTETPSQSGLACPTLTGGNQQGATTAASTGATLGVWTLPAGSAAMPAGSSCVYAFDVTYTLAADVVCVWPNTADGVRNTAYVRFADGQTAFSDMTIGDNTDHADLEITDTGVTDECDNTPQPPGPIKLVKEQKSPAPGTGDVPWGTPVTYIITVDNQGGADIANVVITDNLSMLPGMLVFDATIQSVQCLNTSVACNIVLPSALPTTLNYNANNTQIAAQVDIPTLPAGQTQQIEITIDFKPLSCVSYETNGPRQTANAANVKYKIPYKYGLFWSYDQTTPPVVTDHEKVPPCALKVKKEGPESITYGPWFSYTVNFENTGSSPVAVGTLMDAIALDSPVYASAVTGVYNYGCAFFSPSTSTTALPWPAGMNLVAGMSGANPVSITYQVQPEQGTRLIHNLNPAAPVVLPANSRIECVIKMKLDQPPSANPYCQGAGNPHLVNSALMDVTQFYNTNLQPHTQAYAATTAHLPLCHAINVGKSFDQPIVAPGVTVQVTLSLANIGDDPIAGANLTDTLQPGLVPTGAATCTPACAPPATISGQTVSGTFASLAGNQTGTITFAAIANGPAPVIRSNTVNGTYMPPDGAWYDQGSSTTATAEVGVYDLVDLHITKVVANTSGQPFPPGPFPMSVVCQLPLGGSASYSASATIASGNQVTVTVPNVPAGATCTVVETSVPAGIGGFGFNSVGYIPRGSGLNAGIKIEKGGKNEVVVENCYGDPSAAPLSVWHEPGKDCPPVGAPPSYDVKKACGPAFPLPDGSFTANCTVTVVFSGPTPNPVHLEEVFSPASGSIQFNSSTPYPWACVPANVTLPNTMNCDLPGGAMTAVNGFVSTLNFTVNFGRGEDPSQNKNCAVVTLGEGSVYDCTGFEVVKDPPKPEFTKKCGEPYLDAASGEYKAHCDIYITLVGPPPSQVLVQDTLQSAPNGTAQITALNAPGWACSPNPPIPSGQTLTCSMPGASFPSTGQSVIGMEVTLQKGETAYKNCAVLFLDKEPREKDCSGGEVTTGDPIKWDIEKVCQPLAGPAPGQPLQASCTITVTASAQPAGPVTVSDVLAATGSPGQIVAVNAPGWICSPSTLPVAAGSLLTCANAAFPASLTSSFGVTVSYPAGTTALDDKNCAAIAYSGIEQDRDCEHLVVSSDPPTLTATKNCALVQAFTDFYGIYQCQITVTATGAPLPSVISLADTLQISGGATSGQTWLGGLSSTDPWSCPTGAIAPNASAACTIPGASFPASGESTLTGYVALNTIDAPAGAQNCVTATGNSAPPLTSNTACAPVGPQPPTSGRLTIDKIATLNGENLPQQAFPFTATCGNLVTALSIENGGLSGAVGDIPFGTACTIAEGPLPTEGVCPAGQNASWTTTFTPASSATLTAEHPNQSVLVTNALTCAPDETSLPPAITVSKTCAPGTPNPVGALPGMTAICTITVTNSGGPVTGDVSLFETLDDLISLPAGAGSITAFSSPQPWQFPPTPVTMGAAAQATLPGVALAQAGNTSTVTVTVNIANPQMAGEMQNCVSAVATDPTGNTLANAPQVCVPFTPPPTGTPGVVTATKSCTPVTTTIFPVTIQCAITVTLTGAPPAGMIDITERLFDADTGRQTTIITAMSSPTAGWSLPGAFPIHANIDSHLQISGAALAAAGGTSTINVTVSLPDAGTANYETKNCIQLRQDVTGDTDFVDAGETSPPICALFQVTVPPNILVTPDAPDCDKATARKNGEACACRFDNMRKVSATACGCADGFAFEAGKGCAKKTAEPKCDAATTVAKGGRCVCEYKNMVQTAATACTCAKGFKFAPGKGCFKPDPVCGKNQQLVKGRCVTKQPVCKKPFVYDPKRNACVEVIAKCGPGQIRVKGRCVTVPKCPPGTIPVPGTRACVSIGIGIGGPRSDGPRPKRPGDIKPRCNPAVQNCG